MPVIDIQQIHRIDNKARYTAVISHSNRRNAIGVGMRDSITNPFGAPTPCSVLRISESADADQHAHNLTNWQQQYDQLSPGRFSGRITELPMDNVQLFHEYTSQSLHQKCNVWPDSIWLGIPVKVDSHSKINGLSVSNDSIMCRPGNCEFELNTPTAFDIYGLVVHHPTLMDMAHIHGVVLQWAELQHNGRLVIPAKTLSDVRYLLHRLLSNTSAFTAPKLQRDMVMMALLEVLQKETPKPAKTPSYGHRKAVVDRVQSFTATRLDEAITVTEMCQVANVSRRTLQYSFTSILGMSPIQYLRMSRLNGVRRALTNIDNSRSIADIASDWGFWHLSQFAKDYKALFGVRPSESKNSSL